MNKIFRLFLIFIPWTIFSMVMSSSASINEKILIWLSLVVFLVIFNFKLIKQFEVIVITNIIVFIAVFINYSHSWSLFLMHHPATCCYASLALVAAVSIVAGKPFTIKYSGGGVSEEKRNIFSL